MSLELFLSNKASQDCHTENETGIEQTMRVSRYFNFEILRKLFLKESKSANSQEFELLAAKETIH
jgi:hypothetical protein